MPPHHTSDNYAPVLMSRSSKTQAAPVDEGDGHLGMPENSPVAFLAETIERVPIDSIAPHPANPNVGDVGAIGESIEQVGFYSTIYVQRSSGLILAGEHRWRALRDKGVTDAPVVFLDVDDEDALRILIADNEIPRRTSHPDESRLAELLVDLATQTPRGLLGTGFDGTGLDRLLGELNAPLRTGGNQDDTPIAPPENPVTQPGDLWQLGAHRLLCGDSRDADQVRRLIDGTPVQMAFTSPPYADRRKYDESTEFKPIPPDEYVEWFRPVSANVAEHLVSDGSWFVNIRAGAEGLDTDLYVFDLVIAHVREWGWHFATEFCWERNGVPKHAGRRLKNQWEPIFQFVHDEWKFHAWRNALHGLAVRPMGKGNSSGNWSDPDGPGPTQGDGTPLFADNRVDEGLTLPGNRLPTFQGTHEATGHTAAFPVGLPAFFVRMCTDDGEAVYDPFVGSGSTILACEQERRVGLGMELSPAYCDIVVDRWQRLTGQTAVRL